MVQEIVVRINGASSGIGAALAREWGHWGAWLILSSRFEDTLRQFVEENIFDPLDDQQARGMSAEECTRQTIRTWRRAGMWF